ncbi:MAG: HesA/MoeB/ThiF family protein [Gemmatimonadales bacterium]
MTSPGGAHVVVVGAGGNIGSHLVPLLARMPEVARLTLIDRDRYEERNLPNQDLTRGETGRAKAKAAARRARAIRLGLRVTAIAADVETLPTGQLRGDLILAGLDSRRARQRVNQAAWRLGVPWLDGGVLADGSLARVTSFRPGRGSCLECRWDAADYAALEQSYPCEAHTVSAPTAAPAALGALAASLLALEAGKLLRGEDGALAPGAEWVIDAAHQRHYVTAANRNPDCRMADHDSWTIDPVRLDPNTPIGTAAEMLGRELATDGSSLGARHSALGGLAISVEGQRIVRRLSCEQCGSPKPVLRLLGRLGAGDLRCRRCGGRTGLNGFGLLERVDLCSLTRTELRRPVSAIGLRPGDLITVTSGRSERHFEVTP